MTAAGYNTAYGSRAAQLSRGIRDGRRSDEGGPEAALAIPFRVSGSRGSGVGAARWRGVGQGRELRALARVMLVKAPENQTGRPTTLSSVVVTSSPAGGSGSA